MKRSLFALALALVALSVITCGDDECQAGTEGCPCISGGQCVSDLVCASNTCVDRAGSGSQGLVEGNSCSEEGTLECGQTIARDRIVALTCQTGTYEVAFGCPGIQDCTSVVGADQVDCGGIHYAVNGNPCATEGSQVCSLDGESVLVCQGGEWFDGIHCPPSTCTNIPDAQGDGCSGHWCSNCGYSEGDWCAFQAGSVVCSTDLAQILQCSSGTTTVYEDCAASGQTCTWFPDGIACT